MYFECPPRQALSSGDRDPEMKKNMRFQLLRRFSSNGRTRYWSSHPHTHTAMNGGQCFEGNERCPVMLLNQESWPRFLDPSRDGRRQVSGRKCPSWIGHVKGEEELIRRGGRERWEESADQGQTSSKTLGWEGDWRVWDTEMQWEGTQQRRGE